MRHALKILIIEDSSDDLILVERALPNEAMAISVAGNASEVEACLKVNQWDLILSDFNLPDINGSDVIEIWKKRNLSAPLIMVSGNADAYCDCLAAGATAFIHKGELELLEPAIRQALKGVYPFAS